MHTLSNASPSHVLAAGVLIWFVQKCSSVGSDFKNLKDVYKRQGCSQLTAFATILATVVFPVPVSYTHLVKKIATRDSYGNALVELGKAQDDLIVLDADLAGATKTCIFQKEFPERCV